MKYPRAGDDGPGFAPGDAKALGVAEASKLRHVADDPDVPGLPLPAALDREVGPVEVEVIEDQPFDFGRVRVSLGEPSDSRKVVFVDHFVGLKVKYPLTLRVADSLVGFHGQNTAAFAERLVPAAFVNVHLRVVDRARHRQRIVFAFADEEDILVDDRQDRADSFDQRVIELDGVPDEGYAGDERVVIGFAHGVCKEKNGRPYRTLFRRDNIISGAYGE